MITRLPRRFRLVWALGLVALAAVSAVVAGVVTDAVSSPTRTTPSARPNLVFVLTDDLSNNLVQYMPHVVALQHAGTSFSNYSVTDSLCCPSRSSIFSGRFPHDTGVFTNGGNDGGFNVFHNRKEESSTYATDLQHAGYRTAFMGKYLNGYQPLATLGGSRPYVPPGWDEWDTAGNGYPEFNYDLNQNHQVQHYGKTPEDYLTDVVGQKAQLFIAKSAADKSRFAIEVATFAPHAPYTPAPRDANAFPGLKAPRTAAYDTLPTNAPKWLASHPPLTAAEQTTIDTSFRKRVQAVQAVDRMIGSLESTLRAAGVAKNTDIVFSSDNGYHMGEYRLTPGKMTAFDTDVNVPLVAAGPGIAHRTVSQPAENIDLRPTFDSIAGTRAPSIVDGHSLYPLLRGEPTTGWRTTALVEHHGPDTDRADPDHPGKHSGNPPTYNALRTATYTYVEYADGTKEYYDRAHDPNELHDVAATLPAARLADLHRQVGAMTGCHGATACWQAAQ